MWLTMAVAPRDRRITIRAERWVPGREYLRVEIFRRCKWNPGGTARRPAPYWRNLPSGWTATGWREESEDHG